MSIHPESNGTSDPLGVRRPVELPEVGIEAADDLTPASDTRPETESAPAAASGETDATAPDAGDSRPDEATESDKKASDKKEQSGAEAREIAVAAAPNTGDGNGDGDGMPPDRPKKPVLAAVAIGGAVVLAIPILLIGTGSHEGKKQRTAAAANTVLSGGQQPPPGAYVSTSPSATPTPTPSASPKKKAGSAKKDHGAGKRSVSTSTAKHAAFAGVDNVLLKNARSALCADVPGYGNGSADGPVNQYHCALGDADNQVWSLGVMQNLKGPGGTPLFVVRNTKDNYCMDLPNFGASKAGTKVTEYYCRPTKGDNQLWYRTHTHGNLYRIRNYASHGLCLGVTGRSHATDKQLEIHKCGSGDEWSWPRGV